MLISGGKKTVRALSRNEIVMLYKTKRHEVYRGISIYQA